MAGAAILLLGRITPLGHVFSSQEPFALGVFEWDSIEPFDMLGPLLRWDSVEPLNLGSNLAFSSIEPFDLGGNRRWDSIESFDFGSGGEGTVGGAPASPTMGWRDR